MSHARDEVPPGYDRYISGLAAEEESLIPPAVLEDYREHEQAVDEAAEILAGPHTAAVISLTTHCDLCGYRCSAMTWDGILGACPNCGNMRGRLPGA